MLEAPYPDHASHPAFRRICRPARCAALLALALLALSGTAGAQIGEGRDWTGSYAGALVGVGRTDGRTVDVDGFSNWGNPGWAVNYDDIGFLGGALIGRKFAAGNRFGGTRLRVELDAALGSLSTETNQLDPEGLDETARLKFRWATTARAGAERAIGRATLFAAAGLAAARIDNSVTDLDRSGLDDPWHLDPDDSFRKGRTAIGWTIGIGVEAPLSNAWLLRLEATHLDFGRSTHHVNRSANGRCGPGNPRRPCPYKAESKLATLRLALIRRGLWRRPANG